MTLLQSTATLQSRTHAARPGIILDARGDEAGPACTGNKWQEHPAAKPSQLHWHPTGCGLVLATKSMGMRTASHAD